MGGREYSRGALRDNFGGDDETPVTTAAALDRSLVLAFDAGSPITSVAVARGGAVIAEEAVERTGSSDSLLALIDAVLGRAGAEARSLGAICVLRGPGSFTGLRIGLATALGLHQALGVRVAAMPTLRVLAEASDPRSARVVAVVDALRGEWFAQVFERRPELVEEGPARILGAAAVRALGAEAVIGFGASRLIAEVDGWRPARGRSAAARRARRSPRRVVAELGSRPAHATALSAPCTDDARAARLGSRSGLDLAPAPGIARVSYRVKPDVS